MQFVHQFIFSFKWDSGIVPSRFLHYGCRQHYKGSFRFSLTKNGVYVPFRKEDKWAHSPVVHNETPQLKGSEMASCYFFTSILLNYNDLEMQWSNWNSAATESRHFLCDHGTALMFRDFWTLLWPCHYCNIPRQTNHTQCTCINTVMKADQRNPSASHLPVLSPSHVWSRTSKMNMCSAQLCDAPSVVPGAIFQLLC